MLPQIAIPEKVVADFLRTQTAVTVLTATRVYAQPDFPAGFDIASGGALLVTSRPAQPFYHDALQHTSVQIRHWAKTEWNAWLLYQAVYSVLQGRASAQMTRAVMEVPGQMLRDPETTWPFVLAFYTCWLRNPPIS